MRDIRIFCQTPIVADAPFELPPSAAQHVVKVLRLREGQALTVFDGSGGEWAATITALRKDRVSVTARHHDPVERESPLAITLLQALARGEKMDWIVQKATELGVTRIVPIATLRSVVQLDAWDRRDALVAGDNGVHVQWPRAFARHGWWAEPEPVVRERSAERQRRLQELERLFGEAAARASTNSHMVVACSTEPLTLEDTSTLPPGHPLGARPSSCPAREPSGHVVDG